MGGEKDEKEGEYTFKKKSWDHREVFKYTQTA